jgi:beta propeller repeat protein
VVWEESRFANFDIFGYNLQTHEEFQITSESSNQESPAIYGTTVIWINREVENDSICGCNFSTNEKFQLTKTPGQRANLAIYEDVIVWQEGKFEYVPINNYDIYCYNLSKTYIRFSFSTIDACIFLIFITVSTIFLKKTQIKEILDRKTVTRLLVSTAASLVLMGIGALGINIYHELRQLALIIYFPLLFFLGSLHNPYYGSSIIQGLAYVCVFLFWMVVFYIITALWRD